MFEKKAAENKTNRCFLTTVMCVYVRQNWRDKTLISKFVRHFLMRENCGMFWTLAKPMQNGYFYSFLFDLFEMNFCPILCWCCDSRKYLLRIPNALHTLLSRSLHVKLFYESSDWWKAWTRLWNFGRFHHMVWPSEQQQMCKCIQEYLLEFVIKAFGRP